MVDAARVRFYDDWRFYFWSFYIIMAALVLLSLASGVVPLPSVIGILAMFWLHGRLKQSPTLTYRRTYAKFLDVVVYLLAISYLGHELALLFAMFYMVCEIKGCSTPFKRLFDLELYNGKTAQTPLPWMYVLFRNAWMWAIPVVKLMFIYLQIGTPDLDGWDVGAIGLTFLSILLLLLNNTDSSEVIPPARVRHHERLV